MKILLKTPKIEVTLILTRTNSLPSEYCQKKTGNSKNCSNNISNKKIHNTHDIYLLLQIHNMNHLRTSGCVSESVIIIYPKKELAQANQLLVILVGLCTEKDSWLRLSNEWAFRLSRQFFISWTLFVVNIWVIKANGQMFPLGVWELPIPFI